MRPNIRRGLAGLLLLICATGGLSAQAAPQPWEPLALHSQELLDLALRNARAELALRIKPHHDYDVWLDPRVGETPSDLHPPLLHNPVWLAHAVETGLATQVADLQMTWRTAPRLSTWFGPSSLSWSEALVGTGSRVVVSLGLPYHRNGDTAELLYSVLPVDAGLLNFDPPDWGGVILWCGYLYRDRYRFTETGWRRVAHDWVHGLVGQLPG